ncbi:hypothetical protein BDV96DRAFT_649063 [Lophiotrema nucula]|uniref:Chromo domain-containing protein n=1 Tax=Lophiotrema nucula TaxID=690887 RepID=A0A6A5Z081_9PLEO|nr:hypothetical protein BDV96DRAFT_649063 [Lophiotrema nucula]
MPNTAYNVLERPRTRRPRSTSRFWFRQQEDDRRTHPSPPTAILAIANTSFPKWEWRIYEPGPEVYDSLSRLRRAPPTITPALSDECPIPHAETRILDRRQTEDGFYRQYYRVQIRRWASSPGAQQNGASNASSARSSEAAEEVDEEVDEEVEEVDNSRILRYVSRRELERFENAEFRAETEAEAVAKRAAAEELARMRLEKNARVPGAGRGRGRGKGSRMLAGLGLCEDKVVRRGRPPKKAWFRGRGGRGYGKVGGREADTEDMEDAIEGMGDDEGMQMDGREDLKRVIDEIEEEEEPEDTQLDSNTLVMRRSSFVLGSALADSPTLLQRKIPELSEIEQSSSEEEDRSSISSAAQQLMTERDHKQPTPAEASDSDSDSNSDDRGRRSTKRRKTESTSSSRLPPSSSRKPTKSAPSKPLSRMTLHSRAPAPQNRDPDSTSESESSSSVEEVPESIDLLKQFTTQPSHRTSTSTSTSTVSQHIPQAPTASPSKPNPNSPPEEAVNDDDDDDDDNDDEIAISAILAHSYDDGTKYYLVKWAGYKDAEDWVVETELAGAREMVEEYERRGGRRRGRK